METIIKIGDRDVTFKSTGSAPLRYKMQFKRDFFADLLKMENMGSDISRIDLEVFYNMAWIYAKTADPSIPLLIEWLETFEVFPIFEILPQLQDMFVASLGTINQKK